MSNIENKLTVTVQGIEVTVRRTPGRPDYISMTDIARHNSDDPNAVIQRWMRSYSTLELLEAWELTRNPRFNQEVCAEYMKMAGSNSFTMSPKKWIETTGAIGMESKAGRYGGGTWADEEIAFEFFSWVRPKYKLLFIRDYKEKIRADNERRGIPTESNVLFLAEDNVPIFNALPPLVKWDDAYAELSAEDLVNVAIFATTEAEFKERYPHAKGTVHNYSSVDHILAHGPLLQTNATLERAGIGVQERLSILNKSAIGIITALSRKRETPGIEQQPALELNAVEVEEEPEDQEIFYDNGGEAAGG